jgi:hypothetical protein
MVPWTFSWSCSCTVHGIVGEQNGLNKTTAFSSFENPHPLDFFLLYFQTIILLIVQETNHCMQQGAQTRNKPDIPDSQQINMNDLCAFIAIIVQTGYYHRPSMILYWTKYGLCHVLLYCSVMPHELLLIIWNICVLWKIKTNQYDLK